MNRVSRQVLLHATPVFFVLSRLCFVVSCLTYLFVLLLSPLLLSCVAFVSCHESSHFEPTGVLDRMGNGHGMGMGMGMGVNSNMGRDRDRDGKRADSRDRDGGRRQSGDNHR